MGSNDSTQQAQLSEQNQLQQQQQVAENQRLNAVQSSLSPYLSGNQGFTPAQLAALRSSALDQNAQQYNAATQQTNAQLAARGESGMSPPSGTAATGYGNLNAARASDLANANRTVTLNDAQQALANQFNAASVLSGNAQTLAGNVSTYGSGASNALNNVTNRQNNSFGTAFGQGLGKSLGTAVGSGFGSW
jgi:hypothetical protein